MRPRIHRLLSPSFAEPSLELRDIVYSLQLLQTRWIPAVRPCTPAPEEDDDFEIEDSIPLARRREHWTESRHP